MGNGTYYTGDLTPNQPAIVDSGESGTIKLYSTTGTNIDGTITQNGITLNVNDLQQQIDTMKASSDVTDIVGNYQELLDYDTSKLGNNDIIKVLDDETHDNARSYYRWVKDGHSGSWSYIGSESNIEIDDALSTESENPVQNKVVTTAINSKQAALTAGDNITIENNVISASGGSTTPRFSINNGNKNAQGVMDVLAYSGQTLSFKVDDGTTYEPLVCTDGYSGSQFEKISLDTVSTSSLNEATYNCFIPKTGNQPYLLNNVIFVQAEKPADTPSDTIPNMTSNTAPYGAITFENATSSDTVLARAYLAFKQGAVPTGTPGWPNVPNKSSSQSSYIIYTYDESQQPQAGLYQFKYQDATSAGGNRAKIYTIKVYTTDGNYVQAASRNGSVDGFSANFTVTLPIAYVKIEVRGTGTSGVLGAFQLLKPAITAEGTLWVNNGVEPLEVMARDANAQWQPFYDVLAGTVTVNSSHNITAITNIGFNYYSTVNMHNISTTAHEDIRTQVDTNKTDIVSLKRTGTTSYAGLVKLYDSTGNNTDGTINQSVITTALGNKQDTSNLVTSVSSLSTDTQYPSAKCVYTLHQNEIQSGTVIEGKFSDLPTFFAGLEGKYCNGTVTYKITQDETLTESLTVQVKIPMNIIIDGNNKTITNNISADYRGASFSFAENGVFSSLRIMNANFVGQGKTSTYQLQGISILYPNNGVYIENCTFSNFSFTGINTTSSNVNCDDCSFSNATYGFYSSRGANNFCWNSSFNNVTNAFSTEQGAIVRSYNNTYTSVSTRYNTFNDSKTTGVFYIYNG